MNRVWYHKNCNDGFCAAWIASKCLENCHLEPVQYGDDIPRYERGDIIYILDFSFKTAQLKKLIDDGCLIILLDHHKTAEIELNKLEYNPPNQVIFDMTRSGAQLAHDYFNEFEFLNDYRFIVDYVADRDLWKFELQDSEAFNNYLFSLPHDLAAWDSLLITGKDKIIQLGCAITSYKRKVINDLIKTAFLMDIGFYKKLVVNCPPHFCSEVGQELAKINGLGITYYQRDIGKVFSVRGDGAREFAEQFGGGGHDKAAGFIIKN